MAASGSAMPVISDPKIEIVAADQTRTNAGLRQSEEAKRVRTVTEHRPTHVGR